VADPVFVNLFDFNVTVPDEKFHRPITVNPWSRRNEGLKDTIFELKGEYYRQFVGPKGPLFNRPEDPAVAKSAPPAPAPRAVVPPPAKPAQPKAAAPAAPVAPAPAPAAVKPEVPKPPSPTETFPHGAGEAVEPEGGGQAAGDHAANGKVKVKLGRPPAK